MAESINLTSSFQDNITPKLKKLNRELTNVTKSFSKLGGKIRPVTKEMGKLAMATDRVADNLKAQRTSITATTQALRAYTTASRKATAQQKKLKPTTMRPPRGGGGGGGRGGGIGMGGGAALTGFAVAGQQMGQMIMMGLGRAFDMYKGVLLKPFQFLMSGIQERIDDEMDDIKTAGGLFSISKRMDNPFIKNFAEAEALTKETNRYLAQLAGALPGDTQQYIQISRQISDGIYQVLANDKEGSLKLAQKIAQQNGRVLNFDEMSGAGQVQAAGKELVGEMTKLTVLGSLGQRQGAMGLPQLIEQMMSQDQVSSGQFKRYAAIFRDPLVKGALERNIPKINAAGKNTADRLEALKNTLDEVVTPDLVRRYQRSTAGVIEEMKTLFLNPEVGMLGLGRPLNRMAIVFNEFGQAVDKNGKVVTDLANAAREQISIFDYVRDIFANLAIVLGPIIKVATQLFMGFEDLAETLDKARNFTMKLQSNFEQYRVGLENFAKTLEGDAKTSFTSSIPIRASLATINNMLESFGVLKPGQFESFAKQLEDPNFTDFGASVTSMLDTFLTSDVAINLGKTIGEVFGSILKSFADLILGLTNDAKVDNLFSGFMEGFKGAGGANAAKSILAKLVEVIGNILMFMVTNFPKESMIAGLILFAPAIVSGIVAGIPGLLSLIGSAVGASGGIGAAIAAGFSAILASPALIAAIIAGLAITAKATEGSRKNLTNNLASSAQAKTNKAGMGTQGLMAGLMGELTWVVHDFIKGFGDVFTGLYNIVVGAFTDPAMVTEGINQIFSGLWSLFTMVGHLIIAIGYAVPGLIMVVLNAIKNLFLGIAGAIGQAASNAWSSGVAAIGGAIAKLWSSITSALSNINPLNWMKGGGGGGTPASSRGGGRASSSFRGSSAPMSLGAALSSEMKNKPKGSHLVIANSSETVVPAANGYMAPGTGAGGSVSLSGVTINVSGVQDPKAIANVVAEEILYAVQKNTYKEIYTT